MTSRSTEVEPLFVILACHNLLQSRPSAQTTRRTYKRNLVPTIHPARVTKHNAILLKGLQEQGCRSQEDHRASSKWGRPSKTTMVRCLGKNEDRSRRGCRVASSVYHRIEVKRLVDLSCSSQELTDHPSSPGCSISSPPFPTIFRSFRRKNFCAQFLRSPSGPGTLTRCTSPK